MTEMLRMLCFLSMRARICGGGGECAAASRAPVPPPRSAAAACIHAQPGAATAAPYLVNRELHLRGANKRAHRGRTSVVARKDRHAQPAAKTWPQSPGTKHACSVLRIAMRGAPWRQAGRLQRLLQAGARRAVVTAGCSRKIERKLPRGSRSRQRGRAGASGSRQEAQQATRAEAGAIV